MSDVDTSREAVERLAEWHQASIICEDDVDSVTAATLRALLAERDHWWEMTIEARTDLVKARREAAEAMREMAAQAVSDLPTDDYYSSGERHAAEEMQGFSAFTIRALPLPGDDQ
jgi:hypothetical protein